ncbi:MAG: galactose-1-phosphate uridylyltransferase [Thermoleophilaceae bacterium]
MPELRIDPLTGLRTIVAAERAERPGGGLRAPARVPLDPETDPFLAGHEDRTPPELHVLAGANGRWRVRVVPNLYPALSAADESSDEPGDPLASGRGEPELFSARPARGAHEVIVNSPEALTSLADLAPEQVEAALGVWRERMRAHAGSPYVHVIVNEGRQAGASLSHTHAQLYALPFVPAALARERERFTAYANRTHGRNLLEDVLGEEVRRRERIVAIDSEAVAICPFASRLPFQVQIIPRRPRLRFEDDGPLAAALLREVLLRLGGVLGDVPPLNLWVRTAPSGAEHYCWRIDIVPRLGQLAGLELGTGLDMNVLAPERAAILLRNA